MMQSAFAYPQFKQEQYNPWANANPAMLYGGGLPPGAVHMQQQQQGFPSSGGAIAHPATPQAGNNVDQAFNHLWQAAVAGASSGAGMVPDDSPEPDEADEEDEEPARKQRKGGKGKKGSGHRDIDKMAKVEQRMIKNRESAARSRMRRQQHTAQLEQENEELKGQVARLQEQVQQLTGQLQETEWQLQLSKVPHNMQRASITVSHRTQQTADINGLPPAPSLGLSLPAASSLMLPAVQLGNAHDLGAVGPQDGLAGIGLAVESFDFAKDFAYTSRRGSSYA